MASETPCYNQLMGKIVKSKPKKIASSHALHDMGVSNHEIARTLGISDDSVARYLDKSLDDKWRQFAEALKNPLKSGLTSASFVLYPSTVLGVTYVIAVTGDPGRPYFESFSFGASAQEGISPSTPL